MKQQTISHGANVVQLNLDSIAALPAPMTPPTCDLSDWPTMPMDVSRFRDSRFSAAVDPAAGFWAIQLWAASWHRVPAASLPDDDRQLCQVAGLGRDLDTWMSLKEDALYGWVLCSDGRYYHPVIAEKALEAWTDKILQRIKSGRGNAKRWGISFSEEDDLIEQFHQAWALLREVNPASRKILKGNPIGNPEGNSSDTAQNRSGNPSVIPVGFPAGSQGKGREGKEREDSIGTGVAENLSATDTHPFQTATRPDTVLEGEVLSTSADPNPPSTAPDLPANPAKGRKNADPPPPQTTGRVKGSEVWASYAAAYLIRYGVEPIRNAKANSLIVQLVKRVGADAIEVAGWFPSHNNSYYLQRGHALDALLHDAEKLRTEWATGRQTTAARAKQVDRAQGNYSAAEEAKRIIAAKRGGKTGGEQ
ncbi:MAG: hypothetical protein KDI44_19035 [Thiothrix sp.]|nr:hypothetical protein [Thiothrix sp.]